jgi:hypothetical protein
MSDKDRQKKDHNRKDKENKGMREAVNSRKQEASPRNQAKDQSGSAEGVDSARTGRPFISGGSADE